jgi:hypothetical protein
MTYDSIAGILQMIDQTRGRLHAVVADVSDEQADLRPSEDQWTIAEIVEHLANVQEGMGKVTSIILKKAEGDGARAAIPIVPVDFGALEDRLAFKFQAPENVRPKGGVKITDSLARMQNDYERIVSLQPRLEAADLSFIKFPHPAIGPLDGYHWLTLIGLHEERHIRQIMQLKKVLGTE